MKCLAELGTPLPGYRERESQMICLWKGKTRFLYTGNECHREGDTGDEGVESKIIKWNSLASGFTFQFLRFLPQHFQPGFREQLLRSDPCPLDKLYGQGSFY